MGTNTHAAFSLLKTSLSVYFRKRLTGIDDIIPDQHYRRSALLQTEPDPRRSVSMYYIYERAARTRDNRSGQRCARTQYVVAKSELRRAGRRRSDAEVHMTLSR